MLIKAMGEYFGSFVNHSGFSLGGDFRLLVFALEAWEADAEALCGES
jgi:hypothetical protein